MRIILTLIILVWTGVSAWAEPIDTVMYQRIGDIDQYISIQGKDDQNPILLYLHGGPGQASSAKKDQITKKLEDHFVVVHWDQRNSGNTRVRNEDHSEVTVSRMQQDAEEVMNFLLAYFQKDKITLVANSWGNVLGFHLAQKYPERIDCFIAISPDVSQAESQQMALGQLRRHFESENNEKAIKELSAIKIPHASIQDMITQYKWQSIYNGETVTDEMIEKYMPFFLDWEAKWMPIYQQLYQRNLKKEVEVLNCSISFFLGNQDFTANFELAEQYFQMLEARNKELLWFESGHNIPGKQSILMQEKIIELLVKP